MKPTPKKCPECGEEVKGRNCSCGYSEAKTKIRDKENIAYGRACGQVEAFFLTPKGQELKAISDQTAKDLSLAMQAGLHAIKSMQEVQRRSGDDCICEAGIIFYHKKERYKVGRCDVCRKPEKPENFYSVKNWRE